jgi:hypothetical protein
MNKRKFLIGGLVALMMVAGLVMTACTHGEYEGEGDDSDLVLTLSSGHKWELTDDGDKAMSGTYKKSGDEITFTVEWQDGDWYSVGTKLTGKKDGKKITITLPGEGDYVFKKSVDADGTITPGIEFDDTAAEAEWNAADAE